jgi:hypothetical protein
MGSDFDEPTPTDPAFERREQAELDRVEIQRHGKALGELQNRMDVAERMLRTLGATVEHSSIDRVRRQLRNLRRFLAAWVKESAARSAEEQLRRLRRFLEVWSKDSDA